MFLWARSYEAEKQGNQDIEKVVVEVMDHMIWGGSEDKREIIG